MNKKQKSKLTEFNTFGKNDEVNGYSDKAVKDVTWIEITWKYIKTHFTVKHLKNELIGPKKKYWILKHYHWYVCKQLPGVKH